MRNLLATLAAAVLLAGCGVPGAPLPPSLDLPQPPGDLAATRKADKVTLSWTVPEKTTDGALVKHAGATRICRGTEAVLGQCAAIATVPAGAQPGQRVTYTDTLPTEYQQQHPTEFAAYAVEVENTRGRSAGLSNQVRVPLAPTLAAPAGLSGTVTAEGVVLTWQGPADYRAAAGVGHVYRIYRREENGERDVVVGEQIVANEPQGRLVDRNFEWEKRYRYRVTPLTRVTQSGEVLEIEGEDSQPVTVLAHDSFPAAVPGGVQAVYSGLAREKFIDLTWAPNTDADLAGYNVYRREEGGAAVKISPQPVSTPAFRDANLQPGRTYYYSVSSVDLRGNESARSPEAREQVPASGAPPGALLQGQIQ